MVLRFIKNILTYGLTMISKQDTTVSEDMEKDKFPPIKIQQKVAILIDGNNIERSVHHLMADDSAMLNFDLVIPRLLSGRSLNRLIYFREGKSISSKLAERLHNLFYGQVQPCHKSADIPLSIKATQLASKVDTIVIMSGDADYIELVIHLKSEGVRVEIAAVRETTASLMIEHANFFHPLEKEDFFTYQSKNVKAAKSHSPTPLPNKQDSSPFSPSSGLPSQAPSQSAPPAQQDPEQVTPKKKVGRPRGSKAAKNKSKAGSAKKANASAKNKPSRYRPSMPHRDT
ncbi:MAG: NYN domain-containing protein [Proteobacteria bacterium]|nr:NYN domain-containing protein [Pseudomonadota bacterium]